MVWKIPEADDELFFISDHHILGTICFLHQNPPMAIFLTTQLQRHFQRWRPNMVRNMWGIRVCNFGPQHSGYNMVLSTQNDFFDNIAPPSFKTGGRDRERRRWIDISRSWCGIKVSNFRPQLSGYCFLTSKAKFTHHDLLENKDALSF